MVSMLFINQPETYADAVSLLEWSLANNQTRLYAGRRTSFEGEICDLQSFESLSRHLLQRKKNNILRLKFADESIRTDWYNYSSKST